MKGIRTGGFFFAILIALFSIFFAREAEAQTFSVGLQNIGKMAAEQTHYVRAGTNGQDVFFAVAVEHSPFIARLSTMPTQIHISKCDGDCEVDRFNYRFEDPSLFVYAAPALFSTVQLGLTKDVWRHLNISGGLTSLIVSGFRGADFGAGPMGSLGAFAQLSSDFRNLGLEAGVNVITRKYNGNSYFVAFDEYGGGKENGGAYAVKPPVIVALYLGARITKV